LADFTYRDGQRGTTSLGTARWSSESELVNLKYQPGEVWLGYAPVSGHFPIGYNDDRHITLVAGSRSGKGTTTIINNLCLWPGSAVVIDPKGENATVTARRRGRGSAYCRGMGQTVRLLDPFEAATGVNDLRSQYNPLDAIDPDGEEAIDEAGRIADALVVVQEKGSLEPFWDESARSLIRGLILHVVSDDQFEGRRNLITLRQLVVRGDWETAKLLTDAGETNIPSAFELLFEGMRRNERYDGVIAGAGESFGTMMSTSPRTFDSVVQIANRNTEFIDSPGMKRTLERSDFKLSDLKTDPAGVSLFLSLPQRYMGTHYRWLRMMIVLVITEMEKTKGMPATGHRLLLVLDEFPGLRRMEVLENAAAQIAGFGVKMLFIVQTLGQLKDLYKDNWQTFLANSGLHLFFQIDDEFTRKYVSDALGETEVMRQTASLNTSSGVSSGATVNPSVMFTGGRGNAGANFLAAMIPSTNTSENISTSQGWSESIHKTNLLSPSEVGRAFARVDDRANVAYPGLALALISGQSPILVHKANYFEDEAFISLFDAHPDHPSPATLEASSSRLAGLEASKRQAQQQTLAKSDAEAKRLSPFIWAIQILQYAVCLLALWFVAFQIISVALNVFFGVGRTCHPAAIKGLFVCFDGNSSQLASYAGIAAIALTFAAHMLARKAVASRFVYKREEIRKLAAGLLFQGQSSFAVIKSLTALSRWRIKTQ
jgi:type IV secretory pathway TraG/TraD family ATPase VirD4